MERRQLGSTALEVSTVAMGCWPIAGMTSLHVNDQDSLATLHAAWHSGVNFFDTAYCYGAQGESERLIAKALGDLRDELVIATKGGIHWSDEGQRLQDARPATLRRQCEESLRRLGTDRVELLYLHAPDPQVPLEESAGALAELQSEGKARCIGASNCTVDQLRRLHAVCPLSAVQPPYNLLQRQIEDQLLPWCRQHAVAVIVYWPLMKGLLAGKLPRDHVFDTGDGRAKYPMFQGEEWQRNQDFLDQLRELASQHRTTVAQLAVRWVLEQAGITSALCGAKRDHQIAETARAMSWRMSPQLLADLEQALARRGTPVVGQAV